MRKNHFYLLALLFFVACQQKTADKEIKTSISYNSSNKLIEMKYTNDSDNFYYINRLTPLIIDNMSLKKDVNIELKNVIGYKDTTLQDCLLLLSQVSQTLNGYGLGVKEDLEFTFSLPDDIHNKHRFILLPPRSESIYFYEINNLAKGDTLNISSNHYSLEKASSKRRKAMEYFYDLASDIKKFKAYRNEIKNDTISVF